MEGIELYIGKDIEDLHPLPGVEDIQMAIEDMEALGFPFERAHLVIAAGAYAYQAQAIATALTCSAASAAAFYPHPKFPARMWVNLMALCQMASRAQDWAANVAIATQKMNQDIIAATTKSSPDMEPLSFAALKVQCEKVRRDAEAVADIQRAATPLFEELKKACRAAGVLDK